MRSRRLLAVFRRLRFASNIFSLPAQIINDGTVRLPRKGRRIQERLPDGLVLRLQFPAIANNGTNQWDYCSNQYTPFTKLQNQI